ncbi:MAG: PAS domain S-box protein [Anaerolineae bacterium]|nr:PAS domain S-box protein [Anaerolineae bacterium]
MSSTPGTHDVGMTDEQLASELAAARRRISELEAWAIERDQAVEVLQASEALYRSVFENVGIGLTLIGLDHRVILANDMQGEIFHKPAAELAGKYCFAEFEKRDAVCPHCPGVEALATGQPAMVETMGIRDDGTTNFARIQAFPVPDAEGKPIGFVEIVEDITERKLAEEGQRESEERFRLLMEHAADAFFLHDIDTRILDVNRRACESLGYTREELLELRVRDFDSAFDDQARNNWARLVPGRPETVERVHRRKDGTTFPVEVRLGVIESGERRLFLALVRDVTERKRTEEMLARRAIQLQTGAEVSHAAGSIVDPDELMRQVVELIRERFDLYYVGLFLVDQVLRLHSQPGEWAYLRAGTGEAGEAMLKQSYRLRVGSNSMVGQCIAEGKPRVALDTGKEAVHLANPLLPDTRSELALPLINRGQAIGALTIQSTEEAAFSDEDIAALEIMAGQIANSIENARLYKETQAALEELKGTHGRYVRQQWSRYLGESLPGDEKS